VADGLEHVAVLSDQLQAQGDPRGELLALELAAARALDVDESRRLNREAQELRSRVPTLAWPLELHRWRGLMRAGLLVDGHRPFGFSEPPLLPSAIGPHCRSLVVGIGHSGLDLAALAEARARAGVRLDGLWEQQGWTSAPIMEDTHTIDHRLELSALGLNRRLSAAAGLKQLDGLLTLALGHRGIPDDLIAELGALQLRGLGLRVDDGEQVGAVLEACPELERLTLHELDAALPGLPELARLRHLVLRDTRPEPPKQPRLTGELSLSQLDSLLISGPCLADLERLADLQLRALTVLEPNCELNEVVARLAQLRSLEQLTIIALNQRLLVGPAADASALGQLPRLRRLGLNGNFNGELLARPGLAMDGMPSGLQLRGAISELHTGFSAGLPRALAQVDASQLRTLSISSSHHHRPKWYGRCHEQLVLVETLTIDLDDGGTSEELAWIRRLPRLRTMVTRGLSIAEQGELADQLPHVQIVGEDAARMRNDWLDLPPFDPLAVASWPKLA
jgi:hypothetical protein